jgi:3-deoxy-D-arabino-heptulosonate 7-phosphate (DAHP) synthase
MCQDILLHAQMRNDTISVTYGCVASNDKQTRDTKHKLSFYKRAEFKSSIYVLIRVYGERSRTVQT